MPLQPDDDGVYINQNFMAGHVGSVAFYIYVGMWIHFPVMGQRRRFAGKGDQLFTGSGASSSLASCRSASPGTAVVLQDAL